MPLKSLLEFAQKIGAALVTIKLNPANAGPEKWSVRLGMEPSRMTFSDSNLRKLYASLAGVREKAQELQEAYLTFDFKNELAKEHAHHGLSRRVKTMSRCIKLVFEKIPPNRSDLPERDERMDVEIYLQAFVFNLFGAVDNLAWIWVDERDIRDGKGAKLPKRHVGLSSANKTVRASFSSEFQNYLSNLDEWFGYVENYRHALAHRIPLYIPPYIVAPESLEAYNDLERRIGEALAKSDFVGRKQLVLEQRELVNFRPMMSHSFSEQARPMYFHPQLIADFNTIEALAQKVLGELTAAAA